MRLGRLASDLVEVFVAPVRRGAMRRGWLPNREFVQRGACPDVAVVYIRLLVPLSRGLGADAEDLSQVRVGDAAISGRVAGGLLEGE